MSDEPMESSSELRAELLQAAGRADLAERMLEVASVVEIVAAPLGIHPVVVGGVAVYFWTASDELHEIARAALRAEYAPRST